MRRLAVDPNSPAAAPLREAATVIAGGGVVAFPTDTLYGLAVDPYNPAAVDRLFAVKGRAVGQAIALVAADLDQVEAWLGELSPVARRLADRFWPGPLTLVVDARLKPSRYERDSSAIARLKPSPYERGSASASAERRGSATALAERIIAADGTVGVRVPDHAIARDLCRAAGRPLTATSANLSGDSPTADPDEVARALADRIDLLLDAGRTRGGPPSTLVDAKTVRLIRAGAIDWDTIQRCVSTK